MEEARSKVASLLGAQPDEIVFTSGATESNNLVLLGSGEPRPTCWSNAHSGVIDRACFGSWPARNAGAAMGLMSSFSLLGPDGYVDPDEVRGRLRSDTLLVSIMHANNETGVLQPVLEIAPLVAQSNAFFHVDAAQTFGKEVQELKGLRCDFLSISGHKIFGPKGVGALYVKSAGSKRAVLTPIIHGGGQERGLRPGTLLSR